MSRLYIVIFNPAGAEGMVMFTEAGERSLDYCRQRVSTQLKQRYSHLSDTEIEAALAVYSMGDFIPLPKLVAR